MKPKALRIATTVVEQGLIGLSNFVVSWAALRAFGVDQMATFVLAWSIAWGLFAVISEAVITPLRVALAKEPGDQRLLVIKSAAVAVASLTLIIAGLLVTVGNEPAAVVAAIPAVALCGLSLHLQRAFSQNSASPILLLLRGCINLGGVAVGLATIQHLGIDSPATFLVVGGFAVLITSLIDGKVQLRIWHTGVIIFVGQAWRGRLFGLSTAIRVILYSVGIIAILQVAVGSSAVAAYAAIFVVIGPSQIVSSSVPWLLLPALAKATVTRILFARTVILHFVFYSLFAAIAAVVLVLFWDWWLEQTIGDDVIRSTMQSSQLAVIAIMSAVIISSWTTTALQVLSAQRAQFFIVLVSGGVAAIAATFMPVSIVAGLPYLLSVGLGSATIAFLTLSARGPFLGKS